MIRAVVDTNLWIRILLAGPVTLPLLDAWQAGIFQALISQPLLDELEEVRRRPRLRPRIPEDRARRLLRQLRFRGEMVALTTTPPRCRDPKDEPVLATAIDGRADAIVSGDADLRADDQLREKSAEARREYVAKFGADVRVPGFDYDGETMTGLRPDVLEKWVAEMRGAAADGR